MDILFSSSAIGARTTFYENNGEFPRKQVGDTVTGTLSYESLGNRRYRIVFSDAQIMPAFSGSGVLRGLFSFLSPKKTEVDKIAFEFTTDEIRAKTKQFSYWVSEIGCVTMYVIECYDLTTHRGCWYRFDDEAVAKKWAKYIGINKIRYYDADGNVLKEENLL